MPRAFFFIIILFIAAIPAHAGVVISEVAWMGTETSASDEWIELFTDTEQSLSGWILATEDGGLSLKLKGTTTPGGYFLIERTDDNSVPGVKADLVSAFGKGLSNDGEILILKDAGGNIVDRVDGSNGWMIGGDNDSKNTLQRNSAAPNGWLTAVATPKAVNAKYVRPTPKSAPSAVSGAQPKKAGSPTASAGKEEEKEYDNSFTALTKSARHSSFFNGEYIWLLGGILGGAILGLACVIMVKWKKSP